MTVFERDADLSSRDPGYRLHINSTGTTALSAVLGTRLRELFVATAGIPRQAVLHFDARLNPGPARDTAGSAGVGARAAACPSIWSPIAQHFAES